VSESRDCSCAWTKVRERETNSMACFRYPRPIFFIYFLNANLSKLEDCPGVLPLGVVCVMLNEERRRRIPEWSLGTLTVERMLGACCLKIRNPVNRVYYIGAQKNSERMDFAWCPNGHQSPGRSLREGIGDDPNLNRQLLPVREYPVKLWLRNAAVQPHDYHDSLGSQCRTVFSTQTCFT